ncbi:acyltransferase, partial [Gammaproteobacteria bacterium]|nr:acyltransferase [Gammaproteobacteria bacterium]
MKYRAEIDGLRALAVVPVILFHAGFELFSGGFVGVDVFFVISGYLITTILIEDLENQRFSLVNFYERRARRILPALFFVMFVCIPFAWMWMLPSQMKEFSQSLVAVSLFASNILFWRESGYFDAAAEEKPLLHTWSLAVEEQYYVLFPILFFLAWRYGKSRVFWMIVVMASISLLLSEWGWRNKATANFYLAPTRAWELFAGSIAAFIVQKNGVQKNNFLALLGLAAIIFSIFAYDENTPFPSVYALVPVLGVVLLVLYADKETFVAKLLSTKGFVGIGLVSYSAYLWHQPLFAFARMRSLEHPSILLMSALSVISIFFAYFSWRYIEKPFRSTNTIKRSYVFLVSIVGGIFFMSIGYIGHSNDGFKNRLSQKQFEFLAYFDNELPEWSYYMRLGLIDKYWLACDYYDLDAYRASNSTKGPREIKAECTDKSETSKIFFIWGDSHAQQFSYGIRNLLSDRFAIRQIASSGCAPTLVSESSDIDHCQKSNFEALKFVYENKPEVVLLAQAENHDTHNYEYLIRELQGIGVSKILLMGPSPQWARDLPELLVKDVENIPVRLSLYRDKKTLETNEELKKHFSQFDSVYFIDVIDLLC